MGASRIRKAINFRGIGGETKVSMELVICRSTWPIMNGLGEIGPTP